MLCDLTINKFRRNKRSIHCLYLVSSLWSWLPTDHPFPQLPVSEATLSPTHWPPIPSSSVQIYPNHPFKHSLPSTVSQIITGSDLKYDINLYLNNFLWGSNYKRLHFLSPVKFHHLRFGPFLQPDKIFLDSIT